MPTKKPEHNPAVSRTSVATSKVASDEKPVALTVKLDSETYIRLCTLGATKRRTHQDILKDAIKQYLDRQST
jgi:predicted DNA-binding protein